MKKQKYSLLPIAARSTITMLICVIALFSSKNTQAQVYNSGTCPPIFDTCNWGGVNTLVAGGRQIKCLGESVILTGRYSPTINGTVIDWIDISNCLGNSDTAHFVSQTFVNAPDTALKAVLTFYAPGVYMFLLRAHCNTDPIGFIDGEPQYAVLEDTVRIIIKPVPHANAGTDTISCLKDTSTYGVSTPFYWPLNSNAPGINQIGSWHVKNATTMQDLTYLGGGITDTAAVFRVGSPGAIYTIYWTLEDTVTHCLHRDSVIIGIPAEIDPVWAVDLDVCANTVTLTAGNSSVTAQYSSPAPYSDYIASPGAFSTSDPTFFTFYCISCPATPTFSVYGGTNIIITVPDSGLYTFGYWLNGLCMNDSTFFHVNFHTGTPITPLTHLFSQTACVATDTFIFHNALPDTLSGETSLWTLQPGLIAVSDTTNVDSILVVWDGITSLPLSITYTIFNADTVSGCSSTKSATLDPPLFPEILATADTVLLCGITTCNFSYQYVDYPGGPPLTNLVVHFINPVIISYPVGGSGASLIAGWNGTGFPDYQSHWQITHMTAPGVYSVLVSCEDFCNNFYYDTINFTVSGPPEEANSGVNITLCLGSPVILSGNSPIFGSGHWECTGLPLTHPILLTLPTPPLSTFVTTNFVSPSSSTTIVNSDPFDGFVELGNYYFDWVICNPACPGPTVDECYHSVTTAIVIDGSANSAIAGNDTVICDSAAIYLYTAGIQDLVGTWTALPSNPSLVYIGDPHSDTPLITGFSGVGIYGFVWTLLEGCNNLSDTLYVNYNPEGCCFAAYNPAYEQWIGNDTISQNFVMSGKYYIDGIITVNNNATLDITNVDLVFATCAGINFENGTTIRANNSVLRACNIQDSWRGLTFADSTFGVIENCSFKNAMYAVDLLEGTNTIRIFNNTFANNHIAINTSKADIMEAITGNTFTIDNSFVDFYKGSCALPDTFDLNFFDQPGYIGNYGIMGNASKFWGLISQNNFINGTDPDNNHLFYGIEGYSIVASIGNNTFTNMFRSIDIGGSEGISIFNNKIDINVNEKVAETSYLYATQIRLTQSAFCKITSNKITAYLVIGSERFTLYDIGAIIYAEENENAEISGNEITGGINAISIFNSTDTYISNNLLKDIIYSGIYANASRSTDITCNEIFISTSYQGSLGYGITINDIDLKNQRTVSIIRNNCVFDCYTAIRVEGQNCQYKIPDIYNNFLYNYSYSGISIQGTGSIGASLMPGRNTLISNNYNNGAVDIANDGNCSLSLAGNYSINNYSGSNVSLINSYPYNSSASCANQITEYERYEYNVKLEMSELTDCTPYIFSIDSTLIDTLGFFKLASTIKLQIMSWDSTELLQKSKGIFNLLAKHKQTVESEKLYNLVTASNKLDDNQLLWFNYYYNFAKGNYTNALTYLQRINYNSDNEKYELQIETIKATMLINHSTPRQLPVAAINELKSIVAGKTACSPVASDLLKLAVDGYDYPFQATVIAAIEHSGKIKSLAENTVSIFPNPASDNVTIDFVLQGKENGQLYLYDVNANIVLQKTLPYLAGKTTINIGNLANGMYLLMIKQDGEMVNQSKLIKK